MKLPKKIIINSELDNKHRILKTKEYVNRSWYPLVSSHFRSNLYLMKDGYHRRATHKALQSYRYPLIEIQEYRNKLPHLINPRIRIARTKRTDRYRNRIPTLVKTRIRIARIYNEELYKTKLPILLNPRIRVCFTSKLEEYNTKLPKVTRGSVRISRIRNTDTYKNKLPTITNISIT